MLSESHAGIAVSSSVKFFLCSLQVFRTDLSHVGSAHYPSQDNASSLCFTVLCGIPVDSAPSFAFQRGGSEHPAESSVLALGQPLPRPTLVLTEHPAGCSLPPRLLPVDVGAQQATLSWC